MTLPRFPGALWQFDGAHYQKECSWEIVRTYEESPSHGSELKEQHVESISCVGFDNNGKTMGQKH